MMTTVRLALITSIAMVAFAANSLLCRLALATTAIDPASFGSVRLISGAAMLFALVCVKHRSPAVGGNWPSAVALFAYVCGFSFAYVSLPTGIGALLLFAAVQSTMIGYGLFSGERLNTTRLSGAILAMAGLVVLFLPGISAPPLTGSVLMLGAGIAWGIYSLRGRGEGDPTRETTGNFLRAVPLALATSVAATSQIQLDPLGTAYAIASGAIASGLGYAVWYTALPWLRATTAATVQLSVPAIAALAGAVVLAEPVTWRLVVASVMILGGIAVFILSKQTPAEQQAP